ncbi:MAG: histone-lysine N-methyltransferase [Deltaproteobacteria bacterium RBG_16_54_18]|nr:MAG: histone-lysine N-methyltransferase [Deltaproteobacteria bacterium RBG_16_54_18]
MKRGSFLDTRVKRKKRFQLQDVDAPNLFRDVFPYEEVCRVEFDHQVELIDPPEKIFITDTTFRDGQQARPPYTAQQIVDLYDMLHRLGGPNGVIRQSEFFLYSDKDKEAVLRCLEKGYRYPEITGWIRADKGDFKLVREMGLKETGILISVSDYHIFLKLGKNRRSALIDYLRVVDEALTEGVKPRCHFEDVTRADIYGFVVPLAQELMRLAQEGGKTLKIRLCDTLGLGVPYPGASLPRSVSKLVRALVDEAGIPSEEIEWHGHNDFHKVLINATTAWLYGCSGANGSLLGFGERTGNAPIEGLIIEYIGLTGDQNGIDTTVITEIRNYYERVIGEHIAKNYPFVGAEFNTTRAGIHADGILKNEEIYNIFNTGKILNRPLTVAINDKSGTAGIAQWINSYFALTDDERLDKRHPGVAKLNKWVKDEYGQGRITDISSEEMVKRSRKYLPELFISDFDLIKQRAYEMAAHLIEEVVDAPDIRSMDPARQEAVLEKIEQQNPFIQFLYVTDDKGRKITRNITRPEDRAKYEQIGSEMDYSNREWFIEPFRTGKVHVTNFYTSMFTGALCITVSAPIRNKDEEIVGILGMDLKFEELIKAEDLV